MKLCKSKLQPSASEGQSQEGADTIQSSSARRQYPSLSCTVLLLSAPYAWLTLLPLISCQDLDQIVRASLDPQSKSNLFNIVWHPLYVESKKKWYKLTYLQNRRRLTDLENKLMLAGGKGIVRAFGKVMYTLLYSKWITNKDLLYSTWNFTQCSVPAWMGGEFRGEWTHGLPRWH